LDSGIRVGHAHPYRGRPFRSADHLTAGAHAGRRVPHLLLPRPVSLDGVPGFFIVFVSSIAYLITRSRRWDILALSSAELGVVFTSLALVSGSIWAKSFWGVWWVWGDMRLTLTLFLWFIYVAYLMLRAYTDPGAQQARLSAVIGVLGVPVIIFNHFAVRIWRAQHPQPVVLREGGPAIEGIMVAILLLSLAAFTVMYVYLLANRMRMERARIALRTAYDQLTA
jgi:heme exporter protein C